MRLRFCSSLTWGFVVVSTLAAEPTCADVYDYHPSSPLHLGGGFNPERPEQIFPDCITYDSKRRVDQVDETDASGQTGYETRFVLSLARTRRELYKHLQIDTKLSASYGIFSGSGSFSLEEELGLNSEDVVWVLKGSTDYGRFAMDNPRLNALGQSVANDSNQFAQTCGVQFVGQERRIAMVAAVFVAHTASEFQKRRLEASFQAGANWGMGSGSISANYSSFYKFAAEVSTVTVNVFAFGGSGVTHLGDLTSAGADLAKVQATIQAYLKTLTVKDSVAVEYVTGSMESFGVSVSVPSVSFQDYVLSELFFSFTDLAARQSRLAAFLRSPDAYSATEHPMDAFVGYSMTLRDRLRVINAYASRCAKRGSVSWADVPANSVCPTGGCPEPILGECMIPVFEPLPTLRVPAARSLELSAVWNDEALRIDAIAPGLLRIAVLAPSTISTGAEEFVVFEQRASGHEILETDHKGAPIPNAKVIGLGTSIPGNQLAEALRNGWVIQVERGEHARPVVERVQVRELAGKLP